MRRSALSFAAAVFCTLPLAGGARAIGLDVLSGGGSLTSGNGQLTFDDFDVTTSGSVGSDLSLYDVQALVDGIAITGPISASDGETGDLFIQFSVYSSAPLTSAQLTFDGAASGSGSSASVVETFDAVEDGQLFVFATGSGGVDLSDSMTLPGLTSLRVSKDILVDSVESGDDDEHGGNNGKHLGWIIGKGHAKNHGVPDLKHQLEAGCDDQQSGSVISRVEQRFTSEAPEPVALLLLGSTLAGLAFARKRLS